LSLRESLPDASLFRALKSRSFALVWGGQTLSRIGDFLYQIALAWWVLEKTGSATAMATVLIFSFTPMLVFLLIGGVAVDRSSRLRVMLISDIARGGVVTLVALLAFQDRLELWHIYTMSLIFGLADAFFQPAYAAAVPSLVSEDDLLSANSLTSISTQLGRVAGPAIGAALVELGGSPTAFLLNGLSFFLAGALLLPLRGSALDYPPETPINEASPSFIADLREGFRTVAERPWLWLTILSFALSNVTLSGPYSIAMPFLVENEMQADVGTLGLLYAFFPIGYILGGLWLGSKTTIRQRGWLIYGGLAVASLMLLLFGLLLPIPALIVAALVNGAALEVGNLAWTTSLQEKVPPEQLGRVSSIDALGSFALLPIGYGLTGWATDQIGAAMVFVIGGGLTCLVALLGMAHPAIRSFD
jgi:MFS family permease